MNSSLRRPRQLPNSIYVSACYHSIFNYPLTLSDQTKWKAAGFSSVVQKRKFLIVRGYLVSPKSTSSIALRQKKERESAKKLNKARRAALLLSIIPWIQMVGITGSLAMQNASKKSDIDFIIVTTPNALWLSRLLAKLLLTLFNVPQRKSGVKAEADRVCMNLWLASNSLPIPQKNIYTAHEIAQIVPLVNKHKTYELLLAQNKWITNYWPNAVKVARGANRKHAFEPLIAPVSALCYLIQYLHMRKTMTRERVSWGFAFFHPMDWGAVVERHLTRLGIRFTP